MKLPINPEKQRQPKNIEIGKLPILFTTTAPKNDEIPNIKYKRATDVYPAFPKPSSYRTLEAKF